MFIKTITATFLIILISCFGALFYLTTQGLPLDKICLPPIPTTATVNNKNISIDVACTWEERRQGLQFVSHLPDNYGMLFVFHSAETHSFWMKNTPIDLSLVSIDDNFKILDIKHMQALSERTVNTAPNTKYVLEIKKGDENLIPLNIGDTIKFE